MLKLGLIGKSESKSVLRYETTAVAGNWLCNTWWVLKLTQKDGTQQSVVSAVLGFRLSRALQWWYDKLCLEKKKNLSQNKIILLAIKIVPLLQHKKLCETHNPTKQLSASTAVPPKTWVNHAGPPNTWSHKLSCHFMTCKHATHASDLSQTGQGRKKSRYCLPKFIYYTDTATTFEWTER